MTSKKSRKNSSKGKQELITSIRQIFSQSENRQLNYKQVSFQLGIDDKDQKKIISQLMDEMTQAGILHEKKAGKYMLKLKSETIEGVISFISRGSAFLISDLQEDIYIDKKNTFCALNGDRVKVKLIPKYKKGKKEGKVVEIIARGRAVFAGVVKVQDKFAFFIPDDNKIHVDFYINSRDLKGAHNGEKVIVEFVEWKNSSNNPIGRVISVLGKPGENNVEIPAIIAELGIANEFSDKIENYARGISKVISEDEISKRRDFRSTPTFTIDPDDAKDFDDALSYKKLINGNTEIGIHIADVSHYVTSGNPVDKEALKRGFSVYLVDRVIPMLPEVLSNNLCSLRPGEEKLAFSEVFEFNNNDEIVNEWFGKTIIKSDKRFTYAEAQSLIEGKNGVFQKEMLSLHFIAKKLRKKRIASGALAIESSEIKFILDDTGNPLQLIQKISKESNKLIEEFMLLANRKVGIFLTNNSPKNQNIIYRIHDLPDESKLKELSIFIRSFGHKIDLSNLETVGNTLNVFLSEVRNTPEDAAIKKMIIQSMAKAIYSTKNIGHYGLHFNVYTHFTSPIRRYPDLMVHRLLNNLVSKDTPIIYNNKDLENLCKHSSMAEKTAATAERASSKFKQAQYMMQFIGDKFSGTVSGVTNFGFFVLLNNFCEGLVMLSSLENDYYYYEEKSRSIVSSKQKIRFGAKVCVRIKDANPVKKQIDLELISLD